MVIEALPLFELSAWLVAVMLAVAGLGSFAGAVYRPALEIVPKVELPPGTPLTFHVAAVFEVPVTVAVNCCVLPSSTFAVEGETLTEIACGDGGSSTEPPIPPQPVAQNWNREATTARTSG